MKACLTLIALLIAAPGFARPAPAFRGTALGGRTIALQDQLKPNRGLLVCFWATWCMPCLEELKHVQEHVKAHPEFPLDVLAVNVDTSETSADVAPTVKLFKIEFPVLLDPKHEIFAKYQSEKQLPFSVLVNGQGQWEKSFQGFQPDLFAQIDTTLKGTPNGAAKTP